MRPFSKQTYGLIAVFGILAVSTMADRSFAAEPESGQTLFEIHCASCHPGGGNLYNPNKTFSRQDLTANGIKTAEDIVKIIRHPGPKMSSFSEQTLASKNALLIAEYILKTAK